jgi:hypothetical protein
LGCNTAGPIEADIVHRDGADGLFVVSVGDDGRVHPCNGGVVEEHSVVPVPAFIAGAGITEAIVDTAVVADVRSPISRMPNVLLALIPPVAWSPD